VVINGETVLTTITTGDWASQTSITHFATATIIPKVKARNASPLQKRDNSVVPAVCYATCNNCYIEAQRFGLSPALCQSDSAFESDYSSCQDCVTNNGDSLKISLLTYVDPEFAPFVSFCNAVPAQSAVESTSTSTSTPAPVTQNVVITTQTAPTPTVSVAITSQVPVNTPPTSSAPTSSTPAPSTTKSAAGVFTSTSSSASSTTSGPAQVNKNSGNGLRPSSVLFSASILFFSALALLL
jgi:hypothetical protein